MKIKAPMEAATWWNHFGLRHNSVGESFEESMKWAYEQGVLADQLCDKESPQPVPFSETTEKDTDIWDKLDLARDEEESLMKVDGFDDCIIGTVERFAQSRILLYSVRKIIDKMVAAGMEVEQAWEFFHYNISGAWVGEGTPAFAYIVE